MPPERKRALPRRYLVSFVVWLLALLSTVFPIVPPAWRPLPLILGFPPAFAWVTGWLLLIFACLVWVYRADHRDGAAATGERSGAAR